MLPRWLLSPWPTAFNPSKKTRKAAILRSWAEEPHSEPRGDCLLASRHRFPALAGRESFPRLKSGSQPQGARCRQPPRLRLVLGPTHEADASTDAGSLGVGGLDRQAAQPRALGPVAWPDARATVSSAKALHDHGGQRRRRHRYAGRLRTREMGRRARRPA